MDQYKKKYLKYKEKYLKLKALMEGGSNSMSQDFLIKNKEKIQEIVNQGEKLVDQRIQEESKAKNRELSESESDEIIEKTLKEVEDKVKQLQ